MRRDSGKPWLLVCLVAFLAMLPGSAGAQTAHPPADVFGQLPTISDPSLSPDGSRLAVIQSYKGTPAAVIYDLVTPGAKPTILPYSDGFVIGVRWKTNDRLLVTINLNQRIKRAWDEQLLPVYRIISVDSQGQNPAILVRPEERGWLTSTALIADFASEDDNHIYLFAGSAVVWVDVVSGESTVAQWLKDGSNGTRVGTAGWIMNGQGRTVAKIDRGFISEVDHLFARLGSGSEFEWKEIKQFPVKNGHGVRIAGVSMDGTALIRETESEAGIPGLNLLSLSDGSETPLYFHPKFDVEEIITDFWTQRVVGVSYVDDLPRYHYFDPVLSAVQTELEAAFPGKSVRAAAWDSARKRIVAAVDGVREPRIYMLYDRQTRKLVRFGNTYPGLSAADLGEIKPFPYKSRDGLDIPAYLTLPPGKAPKNLPLVILPHGGPMARDQLGFDWQTQFLANRGYAVLQPNFRGSSGYGSGFEKAGYGEWGLKMQDDLTDGVNRLIADGIADPKRVCIVGGSYGGYAALAGAALTPETYACAASWAGVADLLLFLDTREDDYGKYSSMIKSWEMYIGDAWSDASKLRAASPARLAAHIKAPILLMHGADDVTVRINQSEKMRDALTRAGKRLTYIPVAGETHYMQSASTRVAWLKALEAFLAENIGN